MRFPRENLVFETEDWMNDQMNERNNKRELQKWNGPRKNNSPAVFPGVLSKIASAKSRKERSMFTLAFALVSENLYI